MIIEEEFKMDFRRFLASNFNYLDLKKHLIEMSS